MVRSGSAGRVIDAARRNCRSAGMFKIVVFIGSLLSLLAVTGCKPKSASITSLHRKEAASLISEAEFALTIRELARAEKLLTQASALEFDNGKTWISLGMIRVRLGGKIEIQSLDFFCFFLSRKKERKTA